MTTAPDEPFDPTVPRFGEVEDEAGVDLTPKPFILVGYNIETAERLEFDFRARAMVPFAVYLRMAEHSDGSGMIPVAPLVDFLSSCVMPEESDDFRALVLESEDINFRAEMLGELADWLVEEYGMRPTRPRSGSVPGRGRTAPTSRARHSGRVTASGRSRS